MSLYFVGDIHGNPFDTFSFSINPNLRNLTSDDVVIQLGDFGCIWDYKESKKDAYKLDWLSEKPWTTIVVLGNHENYNMIEYMPYTEKFGGRCRKVVYMGKEYDNILLVDFPTIFNIDGKNILCIPKAESHDINTLLDPNDEDFKAEKGFLDRYGGWYRVIGQSWWPQEKMNVYEVSCYMEDYLDEHFDYICSHDAPGSIQNIYYIETVTCGEAYLEELRKELDFDCWVHGHFHFQKRWDKVDSRMIGLYSRVFSEEELKEL